MYVLKYGIRLPYVHSSGCKFLCIWGGGGGGGQPSSGTPPPPKYTKTCTHFGIPKFRKILINIAPQITGADPGGVEGGGGGGQDPPAPFWGTPNVHKEVGGGEVLRICTQMQRVVNVYPDSRPSHFLAYCVCPCRASPSE